MFLSQIIENLGTCAHQQLKHASQICVQHKRIKLKEEGKKKKKKEREERMEGNSAKLQKVC